jgi:uncharacterized protein (TIGR02145 family)
MSRLRHLAPLLLAVLETSPTTLEARAGGGPEGCSAALDAVAAAPANHRVLFENGEVRVLDVVVPVGTREPLHAHCWPSVLYVMSRGKLREYDASGRVVREEKEAPKAAALPFVTWLPAGEPHAMENLDTQPIHLVRVELKNSKSASVVDERTQWTVENLNLDTPPSYCYDDAQENCRRYGRLYPWDSAQRACLSLGQGWRLPTDDEWRRLAKRNGGVSEDSDDQGKAAYAALLSAARPGFGALLGGGRSATGEYARLEAHGFYWTASEDGPATAVFYNFAKGGRALHRQREGEKQQAFSVRCVRDGQ